MVEFQVENPDGSNPGAEFFLWNLTQYEDKEDKFLAECSPNIPIAEDGFLDIVESGKIIFRGYIDSVDPNDDRTQKITSYEVRKSLEDLYTQQLEYPALVTMTEMLSSNPPAGDVIGLLWMANSAVARGSFVQYAGEIYKLSDGGSVGRCAGKDVYVNTTKLTIGSGKDSLARGQYYQDAIDLYIRCPDGRDPVYNVITVSNFKDTKIRLGEIENGSFSFEVPFRITNYWNFRDIIEALINALGLTIWYDHNIDGYSYLNASTIIGRGQDRPVEVFEEGKVSLFNAETTGGDSYQCVLGAGPGSGISQVAAAKLDLRSSGHWKEYVYHSSMLGEMLDSTVQQIWSKYADPRLWIAESKDDLTLTPGDWVIIRPNYSQSMTKQTKKITHNSAGMMSVEINQRQIEPEDIMRARNQNYSVIQSFVNTQKTSWSAPFGPENISSGTNPDPEFAPSAKFEVEVPADTIDTEFDYFFYISFTIGAYDSDIEPDSVETPSHEHTGETGLHEGYGNKLTSNHSGYGGGGGGGDGGSGGGTQTHGVPGHTSGYTGWQYNCIVDIGSGTTNSSGDHYHVSSGDHTHSGGGSHVHTVGSHSHSGSADYSGDHGHDLDGGLQLYTTWCGDCGDLMYDAAMYATIGTAGGHEHDVSIGSGSGNTGGTSISIGWSAIQTNWNGSHTHSVGLGGLTRQWCAAGEHTHYINSQDTTAEVTPLMTSQSRTTAFEAAKSRVVYPEPVIENIINSWKTPLGTGQSVHYLDVYVTMNGSQIPGSPFPSMYIGDSVSQMNISNLIAVGGNNDLVFTIIDSDNPFDQVRCSVRGSLSAEYYLYPY